MSEDKNAELNNLRFKTGCLRGPSASGQRDQHTVDQILETESSSNTGKPWQRLNRTERVAKLRAYAAELSESSDFTKEDQASLLATLLRGLENRRLTGARDVVYDPGTGKVKGIPSLIHSASSKRFTLKRSDRRVSTLKSLGKGRRKERRRVRQRDGNSSEIDSDAAQTLKDN